MLLLVAANKTIIQNTASVPSVEAYGNYDLSLIASQKRKANLWAANNPCKITISDPLVTHGRPIQILRAKYLCGNVELKELT